MNSNMMSQLSTNAADTKHIVDRTEIGTTVVACACLVLVAMTPYVANGAAEDPATRMQRIEEERRDALRQLRSVEQKHPESPEIQMGLAFLYQQCAAGEEAFKESTRQLERALALDPTYKAAWATLAMDTATFAIAKGRHLVDGLDGMINNAEGRGATEIYIGTSPPMNLTSRDATQTHTPRGSLYEALRATFGDKAGKALVIKETDYDQARAQVRSRVESEMNEALTVVERAEAHDPQNALYGYLKAHLRFELGQPTLALRELKAAVGKPSLQTYLEDRRSAVAKALEAADVPATLKSHSKPFSPIGAYMQILVWRQHIEVLAAKSEKEGKYDQAKEIYQLSVGMAKHIREESSPSVSDYNATVSDGIDRWAREHLPAIDRPAATPQGAGGSAEKVANRRQQQEEELRRFVSQLHPLSQEKSQDPEVQLGLAILYDQYGGQDDPRYQKAKAKLNRVLELDPENKAVWAVRAKDAAYLAIARGKDFVEDLEGAIDNAKKRGADKIYLSTWPPLNFRNTGAARAGAWQDPLYEILGDGTGKTIVIDEKDYDQARARVRHRVNQELNEAVATVDQAEDHDPENALYNYYKANLYFELGQPDLAVRELQMAVGKPAVRTYYDERQKAVAKALAAANAPSAVRSHVEPFAPIGDYMRNWIWKPHVVPLARKNEEEGDLAKAKKIYELSVGMAKHIREELPPDAEELLPHALDHDRSVARAIETWADERLASLRERQEPPEGARGGPPEK